MLQSKALNRWVSEVAAHRLWSVDSVVVAYELSCSVACGIFLDQGLNPYIVSLTSCPLYWQADSYPLCHKGSPIIKLLLKKCIAK